MAPVFAEARKGEGRRGGRKSEKVKWNATRESEKEKGEQ
jgi:hypothetical protein